MRQTVTVICRYVNSSYCQEYKMQTVGSVFGRYCGYTLAEERLGRQQQLRYCMFLSMNVLTLQNF